MDEQLYELLNHCTLRLTIAHEQGTGFFVAPGLVVTCAHVVKAYPHSAIEAVWNGRAYLARLEKSMPVPDLALLSLDLKGHPCVYLHEGATPFDRLYSYGYSDERPTGEPIIFTLEGKAGDQEEELKFQSGQVRPGISGAPLLNTQTGGVCGIVRFTRDRSIDLGGRAIPTALLLRTFPELVDLQKRFHQHDQRWTSYLAAERAERTRVVRSKLIDQSDYLQDRLARFVGRAVELAAIEQRIDEKRAQGGYVIITADIGFGKSSIIARMVADQGQDSSAYHFVQPGSAANFPINVVRNLLTRLLLKHDFPDHYVTGESYEILCGNFLAVLKAISDMGAQETIFLDGLDQLEKGKDDSPAPPDLNFLPARLPPGIVIVLGTRPNETLEAIRRITPVEEPYELPGLSRADFDLLLEKHDVPRRAILGDSIYQRLTDTPLYLDLVAQELRESAGEGTEALIARVASNPNSIFTIAFARMRNLAEWGKIIRPILGVLVAAQEPLTAGQIAHIIGQEGTDVRAGMNRLGGFLSAAGQRRSQLFHPKLKDYLQQAPARADDAIPFDAEEQQRLHAQIADWSEQSPLEHLWSPLLAPTSNDDYQEYAQHHYLYHLSQAHRYPRLFSVLDDGSYERAKLRADQSTRSTAQDLLLGSQAAIDAGRTLDEAKSLLTSLWRYTLLRTSLTTRADAYPIEAFQALLALNRDQDALNLTELLTHPATRLAVLTLITAFLLNQPSRQAEGQQLASRIYDLATSLQDPAIRTTALRDLATTLLHIGRLSQAEEIARLLSNDHAQIDILAEISAVYAQQGNWPHAITIARSITNAAVRVKALSHLAATLKAVGDAPQAQALWQEADTSATALTDDHQRSRALSHLSDSFLHAHEWHKALDSARTIPLSLEKIRALSHAASALTRAGSASSTAWEEARTAIVALDEQQRKDAYRIYAIAQAQAGLYTEAERTTSRHLTEHPTEKTIVFGELATHLIHDHSWEQSQRLIALISNEYRLTDVPAPLLDCLLTDLTSELAQHDQWEQAQATARSIPGRAARGRALMGIVREQARAGLTQAAQTTWQEASALCTSHTDTVQSSVASLLVSVLAEIGQQEQAMRLIDSLPDITMQEEALEALAQALAQMGQFAQAEEIARTVVSPVRKAAIHASIARAQLEAKHVDQARATARAIPSAENRSRILLDLVSLCCRTGQWDHAHTLTDDIPSEPMQAEALDQLITVLAQANQMKAARELADSIHNPYYQARSTCHLAIILAQMGNEQAATRLARTIKNPHLAQKARCLISLNRTTLWAGTEQVVADVHTSAKSITDSNERDAVLSALVNRSLRDQHWSQAETIASEIINQHTRNDAWADVAVTRAQANDWPQALASLDRIQVSTPRTRPSDPRAHVLRTWGTLLARTVNPTALQQHIERHLNTSQEKAALLISFATELAQLGKYPELIRLIQHAWLQARTKDEGQQLFALVRPLLPSTPQLCMDFSASFGWADAFLAEA